MARLYLKCLMDFKWNAWFIF